MSLRFSDRMKLYIDNQRVSIRAFELDCGLNVGTLSRAIKHGSNLNGDNIEKIAVACPDLNLDWLITGRGEMLKSKEEADFKAKDASKDIEIEELKKELEEWKDVVEVLKLAVRGNKPKE